ncbi:MAG: hypothetical protein WC494_00290 [Candidatus Pacearchaeota archaeon]
MKLSKIKYSSASFFGVFALVMYLIIGLLSYLIVWQAPEMTEILGEITFLQAVVLTPIVGGVVSYVFVLFAIWIYNLVARSYPIAWEVKK